MSQHENVMSAVDNVNLDIYKIITKYPENLDEKMLIAKNVVLSVFPTKVDQKTPTNDLLSEVHHLTGVDKATLKAVYSSMPMVKSFSDWFQEKSIANIESYCLTFEKLRSIITQMYTEELTVVTVPKLLCTLKRIYSFYDEGKLRNDFKQHGFTWKRLHGTNKSVIVENTDQFMERMAYLTKVRRYRQEGRNFVYLKVDNCVAASGISGLINVDSVLDSVTKFRRLHRWLVDILITFLPPKCILLADVSAREHCIVMPNCSSSKTDMCKWLKENNISYDSQSSKAELFSLVKKYARACPKAKCNVEELLKSYGHEILWFPTKLPALDFFNKVIIHSDEFRELTLDNWRDYEMDLINMENKIYDEDLKVEIIIDKLLTLAKYGELSSSDLDDCDTTLEDDEYISSIIQ